MRIKSLLQKISTLSLLVLGIGSIGVTQASASNVIMEVSSITGVAPFDPLDPDGDNSTICSGDQLIYQFQVTTELADLPGDEVVFEATFPIGVDPQQAPPYCLGPLTSYTPPTATTGAHMVCDVGLMPGNSATATYSVPTLVNAGLQNGSSLDLIAPSVNSTQGTNTPFTAPDVSTTIVSEPQYDLRVDLESAVYDSANNEIDARYGVHIHVPEKCNEELDTSSPIDVTFDITTISPNATFDYCSSVQTGTTPNGVLTCSQSGNIVTMSVANPDLSDVPPGGRILTWDLHVDIPQSDFVQETPNTLCLPTDLTLDRLTHVSISGQSNVEPTLANNHDPYTYKISNGGSIGKYVYPYSDTPLSDGSHRTAAQFPNCIVGLCQVAPGTELAWYTDVYVRSNLSGTNAQDLKLCDTWDANEFDIFPYPGSVHGAQITSPTPSSWTSPPDYVIEYGIVNNPGSSADCEDLDSNIPGSGNGWVSGLNDPNLIAAGGANAVNAWRMRSFNQFPETTTTTNTTLRVWTYMRVRYGYPAYYRMRNHFNASYTSGGLFSIRTPFGM